MRFLPSIPREDKPFLPVSSKDIPTGGYVDKNTGALIPYQSQQHMGMLPRQAANFNLLIRGEMPLIIAPQGAIQKPKINNQLAVLLHHMNNIQAWNDMLIQLGALPMQGGKQAGLYLVDRHNRRWLILDIVFYDRSGETGQLLLEPIGQRSGKKIHLDPEDLVDHSTNPPSPFGIPVILYRGGRGNPDEGLRKLERRATQGDPQAVKALAHARFRAGQMIESLEEFVHLLNQIGVYEALTINSYITALYEEEWFINIAQMMFTEVAQELATEQHWTGGVHAIDIVKVEIDDDYDKNGKYYEIEVKIDFTAPSQDEVEEREGMFQDHFIDWSDERRRDYEVEIEHDDWNTEIKMESDAGQFDDRLQELFDRGLDEDEIGEMDGPDVPQSAEITLTQRLGLHHIFAIMKYAGIEAAEFDLIPPSKPCPFCDLTMDEKNCNECSSTGMLAPNSNRKGYCAGSDWAIQIS